MDVVPFYVVNLIQSAIFIAPVIILGYKFGRRDQSAKEFKERLEAADKRIGNLEVKTETMQLTLVKNIHEISGKINKIEVEISKVGASVEFMKAAHINKGA